MRGATRADAPQFRRRFIISIHAPHAGCDTDLNELLFVGDHFNPRTPCGVRPIIPRKKAETLPISIHAPHAGCDAEELAGLLRN